MKRFLSIFLLAIFSIGVFACYPENPLGGEFNSQFFLSSPKGIDGLAERTNYTNEIESFIQNWHYYQNIRTSLPASLYVVSTNDDNELHDGAMESGTNTNLVSSFQIRYKVYRHLTQKLDKNWTVAAEVFFTSSEDQGAAVEELNTMLPVKIFGDIKIDPFNVSQDDIIFVVLIVYDEAGNPLSNQDATGNTLETIDEVLENIQDFNSTSLDFEDSPVVMKLIYNGKRETGY